MIKKYLPGFDFSNPKNKNVLNLRITSIPINVGTRPIRATWTPELAHDIHAFHAFDAEAELTALLTENITQEIDRQIIQDLTNNQRFYDGNNVGEVINRWNQIGGNIVNIHNGHRAPEDLNPPILGGRPHFNFIGGHGQWDNTILPIARRVHAQTIGMDLVAVQPLTLPQGLLMYLDTDTDFNYTVLPNGAGWYTDGSFESLLIKMDMRPHKFLEKIRRSRRRRSII